MTLAEILLSPQLVAALIGYGVLSGLEAVASARLHRHLDSDSGLWLWAHIYAPVLRAATLLFFILVAYPTLFGPPRRPAERSRTGLRQGRKVWDKPPE